MEKNMEKKSETLNEVLISLERINAYKGLNACLDRYVDNMLELMSFMMDDETFDYFFYSKATRPFWVVRNSEYDE